MVQRSQFKPAWWLVGPHMQTIMPNLFPRNTKIPTIRERVVLEDGDFIDLDWTAPCDGPIVLVLHGLGGSIKSNYVQGMIRAIALRGWQGVVMNFRGCSGEPNLLPRGYHVGETGDLNMIVKLIKQRFPTRPLLGVGYSLGGNVLLKWLGEMGHSSPMIAAVAVSVPFDVYRTVKSLNNGLSRLYQWWFMRGMRRNVMEKAKWVALPANHQKIKRTTAIEDFERIITVPTYGFTTVEDYYAQTSCIRYLKDITVNTLILHAEDDPLLNDLDWLKKMTLPEKMTVELSESGGHLGFISGNSPCKPKYFLEDRIPQFLDEQILKK